MIPVDFGAVQIVRLCNYLTSFLFFFPYAFFLTYLLPYSFTSFLIIYFVRNRPVPFPGVGGDQTWL